jgi:hypothetical protein
MYDVACPTTKAELEKMDAQIEDALGDLFPKGDGDG